MVFGKKRNIRSLRSELKRLKEKNKKRDERARLKSEIFREKFKGPLRAGKAVGKGLKGFETGLDELLNKPMPKKSGKKRSRPMDFDPFRF